MYFIVDILNILVVTVFMLFLSPVLALVVYAAVIPMTVCIFLLKGVVRKYFRVQKAKDSNRTAYIVESINGEKVIKSFSRAAYNEGVYHQLQTASRRQWEKIVMANELNSPIVDLFWNLGIPVDLRRFHLGCRGGKVEHADGHGDRFPQLHEPLRLALYAAFLDFAKPVAGLRKSRAGI